MREEKSALPQLYALLYGGDIDAKLALAQRLAHRLSAELAGDERVAAGIQALCDLHASVHRRMLAMGMDGICSCCAQKTGGGCCSLDIAAETDVVQLMLNLLAGVAVSLRRHDGLTCCYLGEKGCIFLFKPMFCLNYICPTIRGAVRGDDLVDLARRTGMLLQAQSALERVLIDFLHGKGVVAGAV